MLFSNFLKTELSAADAKEWGIGLHTALVRRCNRQMENFNNVKAINGW